MWNPTNSKEHSVQSRRSLGALYLAMEIAVATSTVMVAVTALFGLSGHVLAGHFDYSIVLPLAITAFIGGQIGSRISIKLDKKVLKRIFGIVLFAIAVKFLLEVV